jgi:hypothetical protein
MKKLAILSITLLFVCTVGQINARPTSTEIKKEIQKEAIVVNTTGHPELKKLEGNEVNQDSKINFYTTIGVKSNVVWSRGDFFDEATYAQDGNVMKAYFDISGQLVGTTSIKKITDLSSTLQKSIKKQYPDCIVGQITYFQESDQDATDMLLYGIQFESQNHYFIELSNNTNKFVAIGERNGNLSFFKQL